MAISILLLFLFIIFNINVIYGKTISDGHNAILLETFQEEIDYFDGKRWIKSEVEKYTTEDIKIKNIYSTLQEYNDEKSLVLEKSHKYYGIVRPLSSPAFLDGTEGKKNLVVQYEVTFTEGLECGGAYIKLLNENENADNKWSEFDDKSGYSIMFGPDKCGMTNQVHFIVRQYNPISKKYEEKALVNPPPIEIDTNTHLYTLIINEEDDSFEILIDQKSVKKGSFFENFNPSFQPEKVIDDPNDKKPSDWVDKKEIPDPNVTKPDDWDEDLPEYIPDMDAKKPDDWLDDEPEYIDDPKAIIPEDWNEEDDGVWEKPQILNPKCEKASGCGEWKPPMKSNPEYKGKWTPPLIPNPEYKGEWHPKKIDNPYYFEVKKPSHIQPINALAIEIWTTSGGITFDNIWIGYDTKAAAEYANITWKPKLNAQKDYEKERSQDEKAQIREERLSFGGFKEKLQVYWEDIVEFTIGNPSLIAGFFISFLLVIFTIIKMSSKTKSKTSKKNNEKDSHISADSNDSMDSPKKDKKHDNVKDDEHDASDSGSNSETTSEAQSDEMSENTHLRKRAPKIEE